MTPRREKIRDRALQFVLCAAAAFVLISAAGCASVGPSGFPGFKARGESAPKGWWYARFKFYWVEEDPGFFKDVLVADRIAGPVLEKNRREISLWRFHRRAARDEAGHLFSFIFYATPATARKVFREILASPDLSALEAAGVVERVECDDTAKITRPDVESTSDRHWSAPLQKSWPWFIMGVSETWLDLIRRFSEKGGRGPLTVDAMLEFYKDVNEEIEQTWQKEGAHAFLHHLNALFGYEPLNTRNGQIRF